GENSASGYAVGLDMKINGEFVKGVDSWASLSIMRTQEDLEDDDYYNSDGELVEQGYVPRPSDQLVTFGLFFQDYIPNHPSWKAHLSLMYGSGLPFGPPQHKHLRTAFRMPDYRRVDLGFSKEIISDLNKLGENNPLKMFKSLWLGLEVFNLLDIQNTISYLWITDITERQLAVPNYLTSRRLNVKMILKF
ncbi:MAG: TonB-dependent receptor, partial [Marinilabiliales bacterium]